MFGGYGLIIIVMAASWLVSWRFKSKFKKFSKEPFQRGLTGAEVARKMLEQHGIYDVQIISTGGNLTDHYNPANKTVNLSESVHNERTVAAAAVAAHECGHAIQHAQAYSFLKFRSAMVPALSISSKVMPFVILAGFFTFQTFPAILAVGIGMFALTTLFSFVTLPVEFDASKRALAWLESSGLSQGEELGMAKEALNWAAMTYIVGALGSLAMLLYYLSIFSGRD